MYFPQTDPVNAQQVTETDVTSGNSVSLDRRVSTHPSCMGVTVYTNRSLPNRTLNGIAFDHQFAELVPVVRISGLSAPNRAGPNIDESVRGDVFVLIGSAAQVLTALLAMNQSQGWDW